LQARGLRWSCYKDEASRRGSVCLPSPASFRHGGWWWQPQNARLPTRSMVATVMECEARVSVGDEEDDDVAVSNWCICVCKD